MDLCGKQKNSSSFSHSVADKNINLFDYLSKKARMVLNKIAVRGF